MSEAQDGMWLDDKAGRLVRPYTVTNGRTLPSARIDLLTLVMATGTRPPYLGPDHEQVLRLDLSDRTRPDDLVAEVAAHMRLPAVITKVLLSDLVTHEALATRAPRVIEAASPTDRNLLEAVLHGLRKRL